MLQLQLNVLLLLSALFVEGQSTAHRHRDWHSLSGATRQGYYQHSFGGHYPRRRHNSYNSNSNSINNYDSSNNNNYDNNYYSGDNNHNRVVPGAIRLLDSGASRGVSLDDELGQSKQAVEARTSDAMGVLAGDFEALADAGQHDGTAHINLVPSTASHDLFDMSKSWGQFNKTADSSSARANYCGQAPLNRINDSNTPSSSSSNAYVFDGKTALDGWFPWHVTIFCNDRYWCGGSIISSNRVLTAAHCIFPNNDRARCRRARVVAGTTEVALRPRKPTAQLRFATAFIMDYNYPIDTENNDYIMLHLNSPLDINHHVQPICLPRALVSVDECYIQGSGDDGRVMMGTNYRLQYARMKYKEQCPWPDEQKHGTGEPEVCFVPYDGYSKSTPCRGDSGSALACHSDGTWFQVGILTFGETQQCNDSGSGEPWTGFANTIYLWPKLSFLYDQLTKHVIQSASQWISVARRLGLEANTNKQSNSNSNSNSKNNYNHNSVDRQNWRKWPYANLNERS